MENKKENTGGSFWTLVLSVLITLALAGYAYMLIKRQHALRAELETTIQQLQNLKKTMTLQIKMPYRIRQTPLITPEIEQMNTDVAGSASPYRTPALVFYYNEHSCNVCIDESLATCRELIPEQWITGIGYTENRKTLIRFLRINNIRFPFFFDPDQQFPKQIQLPAAPAFLLVDENGIIVDALFPKYDQDELTGSFFQYAHRFLSERLPLPDQNSQTSIE